MSVSAKIAIITSASLMLAGPVAAAPAFIPIRLQTGANRIPDIAGTGAPGTITLQWRENGNAWGYDIFTVEAGGSIATFGDKDQARDQPHTGEDMIRSVRFAKSMFKGKATLHALIATRDYPDNPYSPAPTKIEVLALTQNDGGIGTPFEFVPVRSFTAKARYCNADMALQTELGLPVAHSYSGARTATGC